VVTGPVACARFVSVLVPLGDDAPAPAVTVARDGDRTAVTVERPDGVVDRVRWSAQPWRAGVGGRAVTARADWERRAGGKLLRAAAAGPGGWLAWSVADGASMGGTEEL
jgi:hypothetical protein